MRTKDELGRHGEDLAARHLAGLGWPVLARNWRCAAGELDLVARDGSVLVSCEVKTRRDDRFGGPLAAVTAGKLARLRGLTVHWCRETGWRGPVRLDVIAVWAPPGGIERLVHLRDVG